MSKSKPDWLKYLNRSSLKVARNNVGLTTSEATKKMFPKNPKGIDRVAQWESGEDFPTYRQLEKYADICNVGTMQLLLKDTVFSIEPAEAFRSNSSVKNSYNLNYFISHLRIRQAVIGNDLREDVDDPGHELVGSGSHFQDPEELADHIRKEIGYDVKQKPKDQEPLRYLRSLLHKQFIYVFKTMSTSRDIIDTSEMRGMYLHDTHAPFIAINRRDHKSSQLFSLAHELAHLFRAEERVDSIEFRSLGQINDPKETFCNKTAAALLLPESRIENRGSWSLGDVNALAKKNYVSNFVALYRLRSLELIDRHTTDRYSKLLANEFQAEETTNPAKQSGGSYYNNMRDSNGELFGEVVFSLFRDDRLGIVEAQNLLKMPISQIWP